MLAVVCLTAFVIRELRVSEPLVRIRLLKYRSFATGVGLVFVLGFVLYGSLVLLPLFMQNLLGWTAVTAGFWTSPRGVGTALCMPLVGYMLRKGWDGRWMLAFGFVVAGLAFFGYSRMNLQSGTWDIFWQQVIQGSGMAFIFVPLTTITMDPIPQEAMGYATSLYSVTRNIGASVGVSFVTTWLARRSQYHQTVLAAHATPYDLSFRLGLQQATALLMQQGRDAATAGQQALGMIYGAILRQASLLSFLEVFRIMGYTFLACTALVLLMRRPHHARHAALPRDEQAGEPAHPAGPQEIAA